MVSPLERDDATWINRFFEWSVNTHDPVIIDTMAGSVQIPGKHAEVFVTTHGDEKETMFTLKFSDKCILYSQYVEDDNV